MSYPKQYEPWHPLLAIIDDTRTRGIIKNLDSWCVSGPISSIEDLSKMSREDMVKKVRNCGKRSAGIIWLALEQLGYKEPVRYTNLPRRINDKLIEWEDKRYELVEDVKR